MPYAPINPRPRRIRIYDKFTGKDIKLSYRPTTNSSLTCFLKSDKAHAEIRKNIAKMLKNGTSGKIYEGNIRIFELMPEEK